MAGKTAILSVRVVSDTKDAQRGVNETASSWEKFEKRLDRASLYAAAAGGSVIALGKQAVDAASRLEQSSGSVEAVFKKDASTIEAFAKTTAGSIGLAQSETQEMATILGAQLKNLGVPMDEVSGKTIDLVKLGGDLAAQYGGKTSDAVAALSSLLRGERDPIEKYGVGIKQADIEAEKLALGLTELTGEAAKQADIQATLSLLTRQTADAQGAAAREFDSVEASTQRARAAWEETSAQLGTAFLPLVSDLMERLSGLATWVSQNEELVRNLAVGIGIASASVLGLNAAVKTAKIVSSVFTGITTAGSAAVGVIGRFAGGMRSATVAQSAFSGVAGTLGGRVAAVATAMWGAVTAGAKWAVQTTVLTAKLVAQKVAQLAIAAASRVAAVAQALWNAAANANPIMLIITLIVAAITLLVMNWETVQQVALTVWDAITTAATWFWENVLVPIGEFIALVFVAYWTALKIVALAVWNAISSAVVAVWDWLKSVGAWIGDKFTLYWTALKVAALAVWQNILNAGSNLWNWLQNVGSWISGTFRSAWDGLKMAGSNALNALISPIQNLIGWLQDAWDWVSKLFSAGLDKVGSIFGFSARVDTGVPVVAASGAAPLVRALTAGSTRPSSVNINIELPQYVGDKRELIEWIQAALAEANRKRERWVTA